jgi:hypothetical protein
MKPLTFGFRIGAISQSQMSLRNMPLHCLQQFTDHQPLIHPPILPIQDHYAVSDGLTTFIDLF